MNQSASPILVSLEQAAVARTGGEVVLRDLSWAVRAGEAWAVVGPTGSGKTTLAEALEGKHRVAAGSIRWPFLDELRAGVTDMIERAPVRRRADVDAKGRRALGRDYAIEPYLLIKPLSDPWGGTDALAGRHPTQMTQPEPDPGIDRREDAEIASTPALIPR